MSMQALLADLRQRGIKLWVEGEDLCFDAPKGALTPELRVRLRRGKAELVAHLQKAHALLDEKVDEVPRPVPRPSLPEEMLAERPWLQALQRRKPGRRFSLMPQSYAQQRMWFLDQLEEQANYNISDALHLSGAFDLNAVERTLDDLFRRHEVLRSTFDMHEGAPVQIIDSARNMTPTLIDLRGLDKETRNRTAHQIMAREQRYPFDLKRGPLMRITVILVHDYHRAMLLSMHHVIGDGWSVGVLTRELTALYLGYILGKPSGLPPARLQYADYCAWQQARLAGPHITGLMDYWKRQLQGLPELLELPTDRVRAVNKRYNGDLSHFFISAEKTARLRAIGKEVNATSFMMMLALYMTVLARYSGQRDIAVGFPTANRPHEELEALVGLFANTLVLRGDLTGNPSFRQLVERIRETTLGAFAHEEMPFERLVEALKPARNLSHSPLFQVMVTYQNTPPSKVEEVVSEMRTREIRVTNLERGEITSRYDLELTIYEWEEGLSCWLQFDSDLFLKQSMDGMGQRFLALVDAVLAAPTTPIEQLSLLDDSLRQRVLCQWNETDHDLDLEQSIDQRIAAWSRSRPTATVLIDDEGTLSFAELERLVAGLALRLRTHGVAPESIVPLALSRGRGFLTAMLAVFRVGAAYLPLDPSHPPGRWAAVLRQSSSPLVIDDEAHRARLDETLAQLERPPATMPLQGDAADGPYTSVSVNGQQLAYVIFTSGSTGLPKGVMVHHRGMLNHLFAKQRDLAVTSSDVVVQNATQSFDISVWQFLLGPMMGGSTLVANEETARDPAELIALVARHRATILEVVPSLLELMLRELEEEKTDLSQLRWLVPTGEALPSQLSRRWLKLYPGIPLLNAYGPTECSDDVTHHRIDTAPHPETLYTPIGKALLNTRLYVLDQTMNPLPPGLPGELYVGGTGVGRGYLNQPRRTAQSFVPDPFREGRLYRTGDKVLAREDGVMVFMGRLDHQVKLRGYRIELGEVEQVILRAPGVLACTVIVHGEQPHERRLAAFLVCRDGEQSDTEFLRSWLRERLPEYMMPAYLVVRQELPLTPSGKVDRAALLALTPGSPLSEGTADQTEPRDHLERQMAGIWEELMGIQPIGVRANFFELGGHSIMAVRLMSEIRRVFGKKLPLAALFQGPTIESLTNLLRESRQPQGKALVTLRKDGSQTPFFLFHPIGGNVLCYRDLAQYLETDRPVYGLQAPGLEGGPALETIAAMVTRYVEELRTVQPAGPYLLGGWSFGGVIAFEAARLLQQQGQQVGMLALLDTPAPFQGAWDDGLLPSLLIGELQHHFGRRLPVGPDDFRGRDGEAQIALIMELAERAGFLQNAMDEEQVRRLLWVYRNNFKALADYRAEPADMAIQFFQPRGTHFHDAVAAWQQLSGGRLERQTTPGTHHDMAEGENGQALAQAIGNLMRQQSGGATK